MFLCVCESKHPVMSLLMKIYVIKHCSEWAALGTLLMEEIVKRKGIKPLSESTTTTKLYT